MSPSRSRSSSLDSLGRRRRRDTSTHGPPQQEQEQAPQSPSLLQPQVVERIRVKKDLEQPKQEVNALSHLSEEEQMKLLLGFGGFETTKGKEVEENHKTAAVGTARRETKRDYRQYMNRRGGFNRPLDKA
uniref:U4/U6.U5 small nuclear ribonucleoprotein 27kDa protein domain-containing protein n=1 Tax=Phytophthora ramorum TaxID=164328 RepID=H3GNZ1_PHYRM